MNLFEESVLGGITVKNHFVRSATGMSQATADGYPTDKMLTTWLALAKGEVGTIITSLTNMNDYELAGRNMLKITTDEMIPAFRQTVDAVHKAGSKIVMQLFHGGSSSQADPAHARILGASAIPNPYTGIVPKEMTKADMESVARLFGDAAARAKAAGFDGIQLHAAHSGLLSQFLSQGFNRRSDEYGGSKENRYRFVGEVYQAVRETVGEDFPVWIKLDSTDVFEDGLTMEDFLYYGERFASEGMNAIEVSGMVHPNYYKGAYYREAAEGLAERIDAAVILTGGLRSLSDMNEIVNESKVQFFGMSRPFIRFPDYLLRLKEEETRA